MKLLLNCSLSSVYLVANIIPETLKCSGSTDDYDYNDHRSFCYLSFVPEEDTDIDALLEALQSKSHESRRHYITVKKTFDEYEKDKRPRIVIKLRNGVKGMTNPYSFHFEA